MYSWSVSASVRNIGRVRIFLIDHPGARAEAGLVTEPCAIEAVLTDRSVMHARAEADGLEMIEGAAYGRAKSSIHETIRSVVRCCCRNHVKLQGGLARMIQITAQEEFWAGEFGDNYIERNQTQEVLAAKIAIFARIVQRCSNVRSVRELGANIGLNILALKSLLPYAAFQAIEINSQAFERLAMIPGIAASNTTLFEPVEWSSVDLAFTAGVLIHLNPDMLPVAYERLYEASNRYILVAEYTIPPWSRSAIAVTVDVCGSGILPAR